MKSNQEKRILVMAESADTGQLYQSMLESGGYTSKVCRDITKIFELTTNSHPHLLIWHLNPLSFETTLEILSEIRQMYEGNERPAILLSVPTDWFNSQIEAVVDRVLEFLVESEYFIRVVEDLLQKAKN